MRAPRLADRDATSVLCIGDLHLVTTGTHDARAAMVSADAHTMVGRSVVAAVVQLGDQTTYATTAEFDRYLAWRATLTDLGVPVGQVPGNHDLIGNGASGTPDLVTPAQWATLMGQPAKDSFIDLPGVRLLLVAPAADGLSGQAAIRRLTIDPATVAWIAARCAETTSRVVVFFHAPLPGTVGPLDGSAFSSYDERWQVHWDAAAPLPDLLAAHPGIIAWVSGHTHSRVGEVDVVRAVQYGPTRLAAISAGSPALTNPGAGIGVDQVTSCLLTVRPDRIEVRTRDHGTHQWLAPVHTITL